MALYFVTVHLSTSECTHFLSSPLAGKRDIVVTIFVRYMCLHPCVHPDLSGP